MPPKKKGEEDEKPIIMGRVGTNLKMGIVGLPNVGKSTFFNVLTKTSMAAAENFPFCTIEPNESRRVVGKSSQCNVNQAEFSCRHCHSSHLCYRCPVPDERYDWLCDHWKPASKVPAFLNIVDIAGLVKGTQDVVFRHGNAGSMYTENLL